MDFRKDLRRKAQEVAGVIPKQQQRRRNMKSLTENELTFSVMEAEPQTHAAHACEKY